MAIRVPPQISTSLTVDHTFRFLVGASLTSTITGGNLSGLLGIASSATTYVPLFSAVRVRTIEIWSTPGGNVSLRALSSQVSSAQVGSSEVVLSDYSLGQSVPSHILYRPRPGSAQYQWLSAANSFPVFSLMFPNTVSIIDVHISGTIDLVNSAATISGVSGLVAGDIYAAPLDGVIGNYSPILPGTSVV
jgi:hypothetical protein